MRIGNYEFDGHNQQKDECRQGVKIQNDPKNVGNNISGTNQ